MKTSPRLWLSLAGVTAVLGLSVPLLHSAQPTAPRSVTTTAATPLFPLSTRLAFGRFLWESWADWQTFRAESGLSPDQREQVVAILKNHREEFRAQARARLDAEKALRHEVLASTPDETRIRVAATQLASIIGDGAVKRSRTATELRPLLTPEQRTALLALREKIDAHASELLTDR